MSQKAADQKQRPKSDTIKHALVSHKWLYLMLIPGVLYMLIFNYLPMGGLVMAFQEFSPYNGDSMMEHFFKVHLWDSAYLKSFLPGRISYSY